MYENDDLIHKIFISVNNSVNIVLQRFGKINTASDFVKNENGLETLDSISMRLQFIGESL